MNKIQLGCTAKDSITGFVGIVVSSTEWLNGCIRVQIQPTELREGKPIEAQVFDIQQVEYVDVGLKNETKPTGGDRPSIGRAKDPR